MHMLLCHLSSNWCMYNYHHDGREMTFYILHYSPKYMEKMTKTVSCKEEGAGMMSPKPTVTMVTIAQYTPRMYRPNSPMPERIVWETEVLCEKHKCCVKTSKTHLGRMKPPWWFHWSLGSRHSPPTCLWSPEEETRLYEREETRLYEREEKRL